MMGPRGSLLLERRPRVQARRSWGAEGGGGKAEVQSVPTSSVRCTVTDTVTEFTGKEWKRILVGEAT